MSLDVYLIGEKPVQRAAGIFIREDGAMKEITREEFDKRYPGKEPIAVQPHESSYVYSANITHNLGKMADEAGIYEALWRPEEIGITKAARLVGPLADGLERLSNAPEKFKAHNPANGWGDYDGLVAFVTGYLAACVAHPDADVRVWR